MNERARRLLPLDWVLIATLVPLYVATLAAQVHEGMATGLPGPGLEVRSASGPREFPVVGTVNGDARFQGPRLAVGDLILEVEGRSLAGASFNGFLGLALPAVRRSAGARVTAARGEERLATTLFGELNPSWWWGLPASIAGVLVGLIILLRAPGWPCARRFFVSMIAFGVWRSVAHVLTGLGPAEWGVVLSDSLILVSLPIALGTGISVHWDFTTSARPLRTWMRAQPWLFAVGLCALTFAYQWLPTPIHATFLLGAGVVELAFVSILVGLTRCYLRSDALERRQLRWVLFGWCIEVVAVVVIITTHLGGYFPAVISLTDVAAAATPAGVLIAVLGYRFLDIDRLISATASYTILGVILLGVALQMIPRVAEAAGGAAGVATTTVQWALSLGLVAILVQGHSWLRPWLDRRLFAGRVAVEEGLAQLVAELGRCRTAQELTHVTAERIDALLCPESIAIYAREGSVFTPVFARGRALLPAFSSDSPLVRTLESRTAPLVAATTRLDPFDAAALATLGAEVVAPTRRGDVLVSFTCLGRKRSGDIYTPVERALLAAVASASTAVLQGLGDAEVIEQGRAMQASLRRYVPGAIAEQLESGRAIEAGEREVTVLFVDLRGYSTYAEKRPIADVFSTVNEHTERVSRIVRARGGAVVEFNGDGMMAVFGAPEPLEAKERQAIEAAREIVDGSLADLPVGIGIATGLAYAGSIRAADRWIWSVIGDTTNLAARLQALTRELDASIAADEATRRAAGYVCADFARHADVSIRGRSQRLDVFALPLAHAAVA